MTTDIRDIARHLGLSVSTVSKALNGYGSVSEKTRARILQAAQEFHYSPSRAARSLRNNRTEKIGLVLYTSTPLSSRSSEYYFEIIRGAATAAEGRGYNLILYLTVGSQRERLIQLCRSREVDCLILMVGTGTVSEPVEVLLAEELPFIVLNKHPQLPGASYIVSEHEAGAFQAVEHLIGLGHRRIAYLGRDDDLETSGDRYAGYRRALEAHGIAPDETLVALASSQPQGAYHAMEGLLELADRPTAVFAYSDAWAIGALRAINDSGLSVPDDLSLVGFDDLRAASLTHPPLTTVRQQLAELGRRAIEALLIQVEQGDDPSPVDQAVPVELVVRQSTARPRGA